MVLPEHVIVAIKQVLEENGTLEKMRAQMRRKVFLSLQAEGLPRAPDKAVCVETKVSWKEPLVIYVFAMLETQ